MSIGDRSPGRFDTLHAIEQLDPEKDHQRIVHLSFGYDFPWDSIRAETNQRVGTATRDLFASWFPRIVTPLVRYSIYAMLDGAMISSFGFPRPLPLTRSLLQGALKLRGQAVRWLPPRRTPHCFTDDRNRTHPQGYEISRLGPERLVAAETRRDRGDGL